LKQRNGGEEGRGKNERGTFPNAARSSFVFSFFSRAARGARIYQFQKQNKTKHILLPLLLPLLLLLLAPLPSLFPAFFFLLFKNLQKKQKPFLKIRLLLFCSLSRPSSLSLFSR